MTVIQNTNGHGELSREARTTNKVVPVSALFHWRLVGLTYLQEKEEQLVLNTIRCLAADLCQQVGSVSGFRKILIIKFPQYKGGHPGTVMGASAIGVALWRYEMRYNPLNPEWFNRDRTLSCGELRELRSARLRPFGWTCLPFPIHFPSSFRLRSLDIGPNQDVSLPCDFRINGSGTP